MTQPTQKELVQAIRDIKRIHQLKLDIQKMYDEIDTIRQSIIPISERLEYPCILKFGDTMTIIRDSLLSYADSRRIKLPTYDLDSGVSNHDDTSDTSN